MSISAGTVAKFDDLWQLAQVEVDATGMWLLGRPMWLKSPTLKPVWQLAQSAPSPFEDVADGCSGSCVGVGRSTMVRPSQLIPVSWQAWQLLLMPA